MALVMTVRNSGREPGLSSWRVLEKHLALFIQDIRLANCSPFASRHLAHVFVAIYADLLSKKGDFLDGIIEM